MAAQLWNQFEKSRWKDGVNPNLTAEEVNLLINLACLTSDADLKRFAEEAAGYYIGRKEYFFERKS